MTEESRRDDGALARDWTTLWRSELAAIAADPESALAMQTLLAAWLRASASFDRPLPAAAGTDAPARPASAGAAAGARDAEIERLRRRVDELERLLATAEDDGGGAAG